MKIEKITYSVFYKGKQFSLLLHKSEKMLAREKVLVRKNSISSHSYIRKGS